MKVSLAEIFNIIIMRNITNLGDNLKLGLVKILKLKYLVHKNFLLYSS